MGSKFQFRAYQSFVCNLLSRVESFAGKEGRGNISIQKECFKACFLYFFKSDHVLFLINMDNDVY